MSYAVSHDSPPSPLPSDHAIFILDRHGYVAAIHADETLFGTYKKAELIGRHYASLYTDSRHTKLLDAALNAGDSHVPVCLETWLPLARGERTRVEIAMHVLKGEDASVHGFAMVVRGIPGSNRVHDHANDYERRFRLFVNGATDYAFCMLDLDGNVQDWNPGAQRLTGYTTAAVTGRSFAMLFGEVPTSDFLPQWLQSASRQGRADIIECEIRRADGVHFPAEVSVEAVYESDNSALGFALIIRDRTQQQLTERRLHEAREQIVHAQKIEAIGHLTGGIAHDFNNALQGIISSLELASLSMDRQHPAQAKRYIMVSLDAALRAGRLTQRLLSLARRKASSSHRTNAAKVLNSMRELLDRTLGDDITLDVQFPDDLPALACDSGQLESALVNLAVNARDAMGGHGHLSMTCRILSPDDTSVQVPLDDSHDAYLEVSVTDNGPGMSEEVRQRAFEPFFTTKPEGRGTGLGLSMVYGFVTQHGGAVDIRSMPGAGTSVLLYLPCDKTALETAPEKNQKPAPDLRGYRILVVEDNETIRYSVAARLRQLGSDVFEAGSGDQALAILASSQSWDLLLTDIDLPAMSGYDLCCRARERFADLRVILMTGHADSKWMNAENLDTTTDTLIKPFDMSDLLSKVQALLQPEE